MEKYLTGAVSAVAGLLAPVEPLAVCAAAFVAIDFVTGVLADRRRTLRNGGEWTFSSRKAWRTVTKMCFVMGGIVLAWLIDSLVECFAQIHLAKLFTGFVCGVEFWSYLENASELSGQPVFESFRRFAMRFLKGQGGEAKDGGENK